MPAAKIVDDIQKQIEVSVGFQRSYWQNVACCVEAGPLAELVIQCLALVCPDIIGDAEIIGTGFHTIIRFHVRGKRIKR